MWIIPVCRLIVNEFFGPCCNKKLCDATRAENLVNYKTNFLQRKQKNVGCGIASNCECQPASEPFSPFVDCLLPKLRFPLQCA